MKPSAVGVLLVFLAIAITGKESSAASFPVPELEPYRLPSLSSGPLLIRKIRNGRSTPEDVLKVLGPPPIGGVGGLTVEEILARREWSYPVRMHSRTKAPMLKVWVDGAGLVTKWGFFHPVTGQPLPIRETSEQAMAAARRAKSMVILVLADLLQPGHTTEWQLVSRLTVGSTPKYVRQPEGDGHLLTFFVDRPSPLFVPSDKLVVRFDQAGVVSVIVNERSNFYAPGK